MYTATSIFLQSLSNLNITHLFVNWGSDHPAFLEDLEMQRMEDGRTPFNVITCPNEMVALSAAQGYAQVLGRPAAVIVHVDALVGAVHNVDRSRCPAIIFSGASPQSSEREHAGAIAGARNEWIMWLQGIPDQAAIVRQYMRHTAQINSVQMVQRSVNRAFQISLSQPRGPVYLWARREVMEQPISEETFKGIQTSSMHFPTTVSPSALSPTDGTMISAALLKATSPVIITSFLGRNPNAVKELIALAELLAIPIVNACPSSVNIPFSHPSYAGTTYLFKGTQPHALTEADVIIVIECEIPWIPVCDEPNNLNNGLQVYVLDSADPLKVNVGYWNVPATGIFRADAEIALRQITDSIINSIILQQEGDCTSMIESRRTLLQSRHEKLVNKTETTELVEPTIRSKNSTDSTLTSSSFTVPNIMRALRGAVSNATPSKGSKVLFLNEAISNYPFVWTHLRPEVPGQVISSGGSSLGWGLGAAVGAVLADKEEEAKVQRELTVLVVGDGSFMFGVPSSAYWMARRYETPFLTIVLNNGGWKSPKFSMLGVHPNGYGSQASGDRLSVGFGPDAPDYAQIAVAASSGWAIGEKVGGPECDSQAISSLDGSDTDRITRLQETIENAIRRVVDDRRCVVLDCVLESI